MSHHYKHYFEELPEVWNQTHRDYRREATLHELFVEQVERTPEATALVDGEQVVSYQELNSRAYSGQWNWAWGCWRYSRLAGHICHSIHRIQRRDCN